VHGYEPVRTAGPAGRVIGYVASGGYGHRVEKSIAFAYLPSAHVEIGTQLEIGVLGDRRGSLESRCTTRRTSACSPEPQA
jgi:glycine cleavage system aminomethyltransferase T